MKVGEYRYIRRGRVFRIYKCTSSDETGEVRTPTNESYCTSEEARKRVYQLNGWRMKDETIQ